MRLQEFFHALDKAGIEFVLVGGLAVQLHGFIRATIDVDIVLAMNQNNLSRFIAECKRMALVPSIPVPIEALADSQQIDTWYREKGMVAFSLREQSPAGLVVDILVRPCVPYELLAQRAIKGQLAGHAIAIASLDDLITMKREAGRPRDLIDIAALEQLARGEDPNA